LSINPFVVELSLSVINVFESILGLFVKLRLEVVSHVLGNVVVLLKGS
jgi:hypothetical protein